MVIYREREIDTGLVFLIGTITESKERIRHALERKGGRMNMCTALEELKNEGRIIGFLEASKGFGATREEAEKKSERHMDKMPKRQQLIWKNTGRMDVTKENTSSNIRVFILFTFMKNAWLTFEWKIRIIFYVIVDSR